MYGFLTTFEMTEELNNFMSEEYTLSCFLTGKSEHTLMLFHHFVDEYQKLAPITLHPAKTMIGIANSRKRIAYITQLGKNFIHVVFPFKQRYEDNLCFQKIAFDSFLVIPAGNLIVITLGA